MGNQAGQKSSEIGRGPAGRVLYVGHSYYNTWYLSRALRELGWKADTLNLDPEESHQIYYHGEDFRFHYRNRLDVLRHLRFYLKSLRSYDIFQFSGKWGLKFLHDFDQHFKSVLPERWDIKLLKKFGKKGEVKIYEGCDHGFFNDTRKDVYAPEAAKDAWEHTLRLFAENLKG